MAVSHSVAAAVAQASGKNVTNLPFIGEGEPPQAPIISSVTISGDTRVGDVLSSSISYTQAPRPGGTPSYQWQRDAVDIAGATSSTYTLVAADAGAAITLVFSITNSEGSDGPVTSNTINADALSAPSITGVPTISGTPQEGQTLTATAASPVTGNPPPTQTWQWERDGTPIAGATSSTYTLVSADANTAITVVQTETNTQGADTAESAATTINAAPEISGSPTISGTETVGSTLTASAASVTGTPTPSRTWQWQRSDNGTTGWASISGATSSTYELVSADEDKYVRVRQTETNSLGSDTADSAASGQISDASVTVTGGTVSDSGGYRTHTFTSGGTLTVSGGSQAVEYCVVAGGGAGGGGSGGGGGGGGVVTGSTTLAADSYTVTVGAGGAGQLGASVGNDGSDSSLGAVATATGGGGGGGGASNVNGRAGGSGGGASAGALGTGGAGTVGQGNDGGDSTTSSGGAGGGGAGAVGEDAPGGDSTGGDGGAGTEWPASSGTFYGGGGGGLATDGSNGAGGSGGGGAGNDTGDAVDGTANTGGGGGGCRASATTGDGGSGVVIVRYLL